MKTFISLISLALLLSACGGAGGMSAHIPESPVITQTNATIPNFDFTDNTAEPDLDVEYPAEEEPVATTTTTIMTTTTTTTLATTTTSNTTTTLKGQVTTTTFLPSTTTTLQIAENEEIVVIGKRELELDFDPASIGPAVTKEDFTGTSQLSPTIYYIKIVDENSGFYSCPAEQKVPMWGKNNQELLKVCPKTHAKCLLEGSCIIVQGEKRIPINYAERDKNTLKLKFFMFDVNVCPYGVGTSEKLCLDPYYSIAADLSLYKVGDVIYVPAIVGLDLGNGKRHNGFFIVRDMGHLIKMTGRFDFFTGYQIATSAKNPFKNLKLADSGTRLKYYRVKTGSRLNKYIKGLRNYPGVPGTKK